MAAVIKGYSRIGLHGDGSLWSFSRASEVPRRPKKGSQDSEKWSWPLWRGGYGKFKIQSSDYMSSCLNGQIGEWRLLRLQGLGCRLMDYRNWDRW